MMNSTGGFCLVVVVGMVIGVLSGGKHALGFVRAVRMNKNLLESVSVEERLSLRDEVLLAFQHAYESYHTHAYPADELMPLSCKGRDWKHRTRGTIDDALGGYGLTMLDSLDMHAIVGDGPAFREAVATVVRDFQSGVLSFDRDVVVSVFEASIRVLGGLLSAHQIAKELEPGGRLAEPGWYKGELLDLAYDLGSRLLPAFNTPLGIPVHRVNLRTGIPKGETRDTCSAAAGTFLLEFAALSRLTGDPKFEAAARRSVETLWNMRSPLGLVGGGVRGNSGLWKTTHASIGAGTDSFYEYLHKSAELLGDRDMALKFEEAFAGIEEHLVWGGWHVEMDLYQGNEAPPFSYRVSALQAFWPAIQASAGHVESAEQTFDLLFGLWEKFEAMPDAYDALSDKLLHYGRDSPLRPELAESTLALYRATGKTKYLRAGKDLLRALHAKNRVACGYAALADVKSGRLDDRMDSFFISETLKYLFLLFDSSLPVEERQSILCTAEHEVLLNSKAAEVAAAVASTTTTVTNANNGTAIVSNSSTSSSLASVEIDPAGGQRFERQPTGLSSEQMAGMLKNQAVRLEKSEWRMGTGGTSAATTTQSRESKLAPSRSQGDTTASTDGGNRHGHKSRRAEGIMPAAEAGEGDSSYFASNDENKRGEAGIGVEETLAATTPAVAREANDETSTAAGAAAVQPEKQPPQCIRWSNTVLTTEGHPLLIEPLTTTAEAAAINKSSFLSSPKDHGERKRQSGVGTGITYGGRGSETPGVKSQMMAEWRTATVAAAPDGRGMFSPPQYFTQAAKSDGIWNRPKDAEFEVKCFTSGKCHFHDSGPKFLSYLKRVSGGKWTKALTALCEWVRDTNFSVADKSGLRDGEGLTYRLQTTMPETNWEVLDATGAAYRDNVAR